MDAITTPATDRFPFVKREDLDEFVRLYNPANRHERKATWSAENPDGRWRVYESEELIARDKASLDIFWLRDESLEDSDNLPDPASCRPSPKPCGCGWGWTAQAPKQS